MAFSLSSWFKGKPESESDPSVPDAPQGKQTARVPAPAPTPAAPPTSVRTVMPSSAPVQNPVSLRPPGAPPLPKPPSTITRNLPVRPPGRKVSFPIPSAAIAPSATSVPAPSPVSLPPAPAPAMEAPDVAVHLAVGDFIDRIPPGYLQPGDFDRERVIEFRASELYSDLSKGRASVPASTIYAKCPEIFARPVTDTEDFEVQLPLQKLVEQLSAAFTTRNDQVAEENVGEIETPFLKVAMEDNARLPTAAGTVAGAVRPLTAQSVPPPPTEETASSGIPQRPAHRTGQISTISSKPAVEPVPAPALAPISAPINPGKRPPSTVRASVAGGKIRLSGPAAVTRMVPIPGPTVPPLAEAKTSNGNTQRIQIPGIQPVTPAPGFSPSHQVTKKTARIQIPPISLKPAGTGGPPRPSGAVPPPPSMPVQASPVTIRPGADVPVSFRSSPPPSVKVPPPSFAPARTSFPPPSFPAVPPAGGETTPSAAPAPGASPAPFAAPDDRRISLGLAAVLRGQPAAALAVEPSDVPDDVRVTLPFGPVERQLSSGRISVPRQAFLSALPEGHRHVLAEDGEFPEIQIPLQEIFQNLPGNALTMRQDQVVEEIGDPYPTPFSQKAEEDAQRLGGATTPVAPPAAGAASEPAVEAVARVEHDEVAPAYEDTPVSDESFGSAFEEPSPIPTDTESSVDDALTSVEVSTPGESDTDTPADEEAPAMRDVPLTDEENASASEEEPATVAEEEPAVAPVTDVRPSEPADEPPASVDPTPVAEALAVLESTAPGQEQAKSAPAAAPENAEAAATSAALAPERPAPAATVQAAPVAVQDSALQTLFMTEDELDAKGVIRHSCQLPGVTGCAVMFADGLRLAGNFPEGDSEGFCAMAPPFFKRTSNFALEADLGALQAVTLHTDQGLLSFFMHLDICLSVRHTGRGFLPGVREKLEAVTRELARMYGTEKPAATADYTL